MVAYQILLTLTVADFQSDYNWSNEGQDLRVLAQNDVTELPYFIESWDGGAETARIWPGYGCTSVENFNRINNRNQFSPPSRTMNFGAYSESFFEVASGEAGVWSFRYGADFGRGGGLYVNDVALEEERNDDLWWAFNWNAASEVLEGSITLTEGYHKLEAIGFEGCCDGGITIQYRKPGGNYQTFQTSTTNVVSRKCPVRDPAVGFGATLTQLLSDPINLSNNPKSLPGSYSQIAVEINNVGSFFSVSAGNTV